MKNLHRFCLTPVVLSPSGPALAQPLAKREPHPGQTAAVPTLRLLSCAGSSSRRLTRSCDDDRGGGSGSRARLLPGQAGGHTCSHHLSSGDVRCRPFLRYAAELHESDFTTRSMSRAATQYQRATRTVSIRFTPDAPTTDASLDRNPAALKYASLNVQVSMAVLYGLHEMPWLTFEESTTATACSGHFSPNASIDGATDPARAGRPLPRISTSVWQRRSRDAPVDKLQSIDGRGTFRPFEDSELGKVTISGSPYGVRQRPPRNAIGMATYERPRLRLGAFVRHGHPFVAVDAAQSLSFFGEARKVKPGPRSDLFDPYGDSDHAGRFGGAPESDGRAIGRDIAEQSTERRQLRCRATPAGPDAIEF